MKLAFLIIALFFTCYSIGQGLLTDNNIYCSQYAEILKYIQTDSTANSKFPFHKFKYKIDTNIGYGIGNPFMIKYYVSYLLNIKDNQLNYQDSLTKKYFLETENEENQMANYSYNSISMFYPFFADCATFR